jgi:tetratricopeptide (TPR) repeat protein
MAGRGLWNEALFRFKQAEKSQPGNPRILNNLAVAYEAVGLFDEALEYYKRALKADSSSREVKRNYSRFVEFYQAFKPDEEKSKESEVAGTENPDTKDQAESSTVSQNNTFGKDFG